MDAVDRFSAQWVAQRPGIDPAPLEAWGRLKRAANLFEKALARALEGTGITMPEFELLAALVRGGAPFEMRPTELTQSLIITPGAVTARMSALTARGLIARREDAQDRRVQLVSLTARGLHAFEPAFDMVFAACSEMLDELDPKERHALQSSLRALLGVVDASDSSEDRA